MNAYEGLGEDAEVRLPILPSAEDASPVREAVEPLDRESSPVKLAEKHKEAVGFCTKLVLVAGIQPSSLAARGQNIVWRTAREQLRNEYLMARQL